MAQPRSQRAAESSVPMLKCPKCRWRAEAPPDWVAPFAVCPKCEARIANPNPTAHVTARGAAPRRSKQPQKVPRGYEFTYSESARRRADTWIRNLTVIGVGVGVVMGTFWVIGKRRANTAALKPASLHELAPSEPAPLATPAADVLPEISEEPKLPPGSLGWDNSTVFSSPDSASEEGSGLWDAQPKKDDAPLSTRPSDYRDPAIPSFNGL